MTCRKVFLSSDNRIHISVISIRNYCFYWVGGPLCLLRLNSYLAQNVGGSWAQWPPLMNTPVIWTSYNFPKEYSYSKNSKNYFQLSTYLIVTHLRAIGTLNNLPKSCSFSDNGIQISAIARNNV